MFCMGTFQKTENCEKGGILYSGKYSIHNRKLVHRLQNRTWGTNVLLQHTGKDTTYINDWQFMTSRQVHIPAQQIVGLKCYTKDVTAQNALYEKHRLSVEQTVWVLNPLLSPSVHCSDLQFLTCCQPQGTECTYGSYTFKTPPPWSESPSNKEGLVAFKEPLRFLFMVFHFYDHIC
jgi:hypothetical protein